MYDELYQSQLNRLKESFLSAASKGGRVEEVASLIDHYTSNEQELDLNTPLLQALEHSHVEVASLLLANGADPAWRSEGGDNSLHIAAKSGNGDLVALILSLEDSDELIHAINDDGRTPFDLAFEKGFFTLAQELKNVSDKIYEDFDDIDMSSSSSKNSDGEDEEIRNLPIVTFIDNGPASSLDCPEKASKLNSGERRYGSTRESEVIQSELDFMKKIQEENFVLKEAVQAGKVLASNTDKAISILEQKVAEGEQKLKKTDELLNGLNLSEQSIGRLSEMETELKRALERVTRQKESLLKARLTQQQEKNICVICQVETKTVLLLPCRHLCTCKECSKRVELVNCPLCRTFITEKIDVFA